MQKSITRSLFLGTKNWGKNRHGKYFLDPNLHKVAGVRLLHKGFSMSSCQGINRRLCVSFHRKESQTLPIRVEVSTSGRRLNFMNFRWKICLRREKRTRPLKWMPRENEGSLILFVYSDQVQQQQIFTPITFQSTIINCSFQHPSLPNCFRMENLKQESLKSEKSISDIPPPQLSNLQGVKSFWSTR